MGAVSRTLDNVYAFRLARLLTTPWENWDAYEKDIIDIDGKRTDKKITASADKAAWTFFHRAVANLKRMLDKVPGGKTKLIKALALFKLFSEAEQSEEEQILEFAEYHAKLICEMVAGDSGGDSTKMASGENSGAIVGSNTKPKKKKKKLKRFSEY